MHGLPLKKKCLLKKKGLNVRDCTWLGIPCCCSVVVLTFLFCFCGLDKYYHKQAEKPASISQPDNWSISPAKPMEDFSGSIDNAQTKIFSNFLLQPIHLAADSSDLNLLSVEPKRNREIPNGEFPKSEPLFNTLLEEATFTQDVAIVLQIKMQIPISPHATNETLV
jgi:hypothetical protein